jgi:hypothetical protein
MKTRNSLVTLGLIFILWLGMAFTCNHGPVDYQTAETTGTVTASRIRCDSGNTNEGNEMTTNYRYEVNGISYERVERTGNCYGACLEQLSRNRLFKCPGD